MITNPFLTDPAQSLMVATLKEFETIFDQGVLGTPITIGEVTMIPVNIVTFGVGAGGGSVLGEAVGGGGGGGVVPIAILVVDKDGVRMMNLPDTPTANAANSHAALAAQLGNRTNRPAPIPDSSVKVATPTAVIEAG